MHADAIKKEFLHCVSLLKTTKITDFCEIVQKHFPNKTLTGKKASYSVQYNWFCYFSEKGSSSCHRQSLLFTHMHQQ
jgi:hypothetical protein